MSDLFAEELEFAADSLMNNFRGAVGASWSMEWEWEEGVGVARTPGLVANRIAWLDAGIKDPTPALVVARQIAIDEVEQRFLTETDPSGAHWAEWSPSYAPVAEEENVGILRKTETLFDAATDPAAYPVADTGFGGDLFLDTAEFPDYWAVQNYGGTVGRGSEIPPRQYIGLSEEGTVAMAGVFDAWIGGLIDISVSQFGTAQIREPRTKQYGVRIGAGTAGAITNIIRRLRR